MLNLKLEQWILVAALLIFGVGLAAMAFMADEESMGGRRGGEKSPDSVELETFDGMVVQLSTPPQAKLPAEHNLFVSRLIVHEPATGQTKPLDPESLMSDRIRVSWKLKHGFSLEDPAVAASDPDGDGFSNLEEFLAETNPLDPTDHPSLLNKLKVVSYNFVPFRMIFRGYNLDSASDELTFQINLLDVPSRRTRIVKEGDEVEGFKVKRFEKKIVERFNERTGAIEQRDESELVLQHPLLEKEEIVLILNQQKESDQSSVTLRLDAPIADVQPDTVQRGEMFKIQENQYQLIEASQDHITIKDTQSGEITRIGPGGIQSES